MKQTNIEQKQSKRITFRTMLLLMVVFGLAMGTRAQVTIGTGIEPEKAALLDLKGQEADSENVTSTTGGLLLPRVKLVKRTELDPFILTATSEEKELHTGLVVYNLQNVPSEELSIGINYWDGEKWSPLVKEVGGNAEYDIVDCSKVTVAGDYKVGVPLTSSNYMKLLIEVTKPGTYTIMASAEQYNGYYFYTSGEFKSTGVFEILAMGAGTPLVSGIDNIKIELNGKVSSCTKPVDVQASTGVPEFELMCSTVKVNGVYIKGKALDASNTITVRFSVTNPNPGATYDIWTSTENGISFSGTGVITGAGTFTATLRGSGTPTAKSTTLTISTNSTTSSITCQATVQVVIPKKKIVAFGSEKYGMSSGGINSCEAMIKNNMNFGTDPNSIVKYEGSTIDIESGLGKLNQYLGYDIIIITYALTPSSAQRASLKTFVNNGGVLIYTDQDADADNSAVIQDIFEKSVSKPVNIDKCNNVIKLNDFNDEILNGPFGDIRGLQWGEDFSNSCGLTSAPSNAIVYSEAVSGNGGAGMSNVEATMLRHPDKGFFWCGDSGFIHGGTSKDEDDTPFWIGSVTKNGITYPKFPISKEYGSKKPYVPVYNSILFANLMAWALEMADKKTNP